MSEPYVKDRSLMARVRAFAHAARGIAVLVGTQWNARIHLAAALAVVGAGWWFGLSGWEWCAVALACGLVLAVEALNTAVEFLVDHVRPEAHAEAGRVKDVAAGAVLLASLASLAVGLVVFGPRILAWWG